MILMFTHEIHASQIGEDFYNKNGIIGNSALQNYLFLCDRGILITRSIVEKSKDENSTYLKLNENGINVLPIKEFRLKTLLENYRILKQNIGNGDYFLIRLPGLTGLFVGFILWLNRKKFGVELAGDLKESLLERYPNPSILRRCYISLFSSLNHFLIKRSIAVGYRSEMLRSKYPSSTREKEFVFSGAQLSPNDIGFEKEKEHFYQKKFNLMYLGRLSPEKGVNFLIKGLANLTKNYPFLNLIIVGDGPEKGKLINLVKEEGLENNVVFKGKIDNKQEIQKIMDDSQLFVLPSITEGMPRSLIEAMGRGMVAIGSNTGGIPELLPKRFLFDVKSDIAITKKIEEILEMRDKLHEITKLNIELSKPHWLDSIQLIKSKFWNKITR